MVERKASELEENLRCRCGNDTFFQESYCTTKEVVKIGRKESEMVIISISMIDPKEEDIEYMNEYICTKCATPHRIVLREGKEELI